MLNWIRNLFGAGQTTPESRALAHLVERVHNAPVIYGGYDGTDIDPHGVSRFVVSTDFGVMSIKWFSTGTPYAITLDGKSFPYNGRSANRLYAAAQIRAGTLLDEFIDQLDSKLT